MRRHGIFLWVLVGCLSSWLALALAPRLQLPGKPSDPHLARGERLYGILGCAGCHTQELAPWDIAAETSRGWGPRRTTAPDYAGTPALGRLRLGPDLATIGHRHPDAAWYAAYLGQTHPGMPAYAFLSPQDAEALTAYLRSLDRTGVSK